MSTENLLPKQKPYLEITAGEVQSLPGVGEAPEAFLPTGFKEAQQQREANRQERAADRADRAHSRKWRLGAAALGVATVATIAGPKVIDVVSAQAVKSVESDTPQPTPEQIQAAEKGLAHVQTGDPSEQMQPNPQNIHIEQPQG
jgi:hypothetical protein